VGTEGVLYDVSIAAIADFKNFKLPARYLTLFLASVGPLMEHKFKQMGIRHEPTADISTAVV
jgi:hypothetical protein